MSNAWETGSDAGPTMSNAWETGSDAEEAGRSRRKKFDEAKNGIVGEIRERRSDLKSIWHWSDASRDVFSP